MDSDDLESNPTVSTMLPMPGPKSHSYMGQRRHRWSVAGATRWRSQPRLPEQANEAKTAREPVVLAWFEKFSIKKVVTDWLLLTVTVRHSTHVVARLKIETPSAWPSTRHAFVEPTSNRALPHRRATIGRHVAAEQPTHILPEILDSASWDH
ncbi:MAG: hypothetical protein KDA42_10445 [Planctomycetales bacterium]|nr:hypothetical protein [Planctomycetales bacterium]